MAAVIVGLSACGGHKNSNADTSAPTPVATSTTPTGSRGALQSVTDIAVVTKSDSDAAASAAKVAALAGPAMCDVRVQSIVHATIGTRGEVARNSAALLTPRGVGCNGPFPLVAYARATSKDRSRSSDPETVPSQKIASTRSRPPCARNRKTTNPYGNGGTAPRIVNQLKTALNSGIHVKKHFFDFNREGN